MNTLSAEEVKLAEWFATRCAELGVVCETDYLVADVHWPAYLPQFGGTNGMVIGSINYGYAKPGALYYSLVNPLVYLDAPNEMLRETLDDWGWFGPLDARPSWYSGESWGHIAQPINPADA